jgi:dihydrofolate reductase
MKVFIIAAVTADGFIERMGEHGAEWTSKPDKKFFMDRTKAAGTIVMGSTTFESIGKALPGRRNIVLSRSKKYDGIETSSESPTELVAQLEKEGLAELAVCGGTSIYTSFMKAGVIDTLYLTVEPIIFGKGLPLFNDRVESKLELVSSKDIGTGTLVLEYKVLR